MIRLRLLLAMLALTVPLSAADVSGIWNMELKADWTTIPALVCTFSQNNRLLTGSCKARGDSSGTELTGGNVDGDRFSCQWRVITPDGRTWTYVLTGTLNPKATMIDGSFAISNAETQAGVGTFIATKTVVSDKDSSPDGLRR
jgi:hypothetical protein